MSGSGSGPLAIIGLSVLISLLTFWGIGGLIHWHYYVRRREQAADWKLQPRRFLPAHLVRHAFWLGSFNMVVGAVVGGLFAWHVVGGGWSSLYFTLRQPALPWLIGETLAAIVVIDAGLYYSHRMFHGRWLFRHVHRWHHRYTAPIMFTTTAVHPIEFLVFQAFVILPALIVPMHWSAYLLAVAYTYLIGMIDHCGIELRWRLPLHESNRFHDDHHVYFHCNYGHHTQIWDRLHGTVRRRDRRYGPEVFGGRGTAHADDSPASEESERP